MNLHPTYPFIESGSKREALVFILTGFMVFAISLYISPLYTGGDQEAYHLAYEAVRGLWWGDGRGLYHSKISSHEYTHYLIILIGGILEVDKNLLMSIFNGILAAYVVRLFRFWGANLSLAVAMVLTNYYFYVLYFAAERVKFALFFLVLSLLYIRKPWVFIACTFLSLWAHFSFLFIYSGVWLSCLPEKIASWRKDKAGCITTIFYASLATLGVTLESKYLLWKFNTYNSIKESISLADLMPALGLLAFVFMYTERRIFALIHFMPILVGILILGDSRLNMLAYFIFLYYGLRFNGGLNVGVLLTTIYFTYKTWVFLSNIFVSSQGF
jgi:hypothetical protein